MEKLWTGIRLSTIGAQIDNRLVCTALCAEVASGQGVIQSVDDYLTHLTKKFYFPSPVFEGYDPSARQIFPFCAILKLLLAKAETGAGLYITLDEVFEKIVANNCTGREDLRYFRALRARRITVTKEVNRQVREMMIFLSQFTFLKWSNPRLFLDVSNPSLSIAKELEQLATPFVARRSSDRLEEIMSLGKLPGRRVFIVPEMKDRIFTGDEEFVEGNKVRVTHLRTERSRKLREMFFAHAQEPYTCDACTVHMPDRYPWTQNLLEVHHLLPLSSPIKIGTRKTSLDDLVSLCPNCHRAIHSFYRRWLRTQDLRDFPSADVAMETYESAKRELVL